MILNTKLLRAFAISFSGSCLCNFLYGIVPDTLFNFFRASYGHRWMRGGDYPAEISFIVLVPVVFIIMLEFYSLYQYPFVKYPFIKSYKKHFSQKLQGKIAFTWAISIKLTTHFLLSSLGVLSSIVPLGLIECTFPSWLIDKSGKYPSIVYIILIIWFSNDLLRYGYFKDK